MIKFVKIGRDVATRDCTITVVFLTNSLSASLVSSETGRSGQVSVVIHKEMEVPSIRCHHWTIHLQPLEGRSVGFKLPGQNLQLAELDGLCISVTCCSTYCFQVSGSLSSTKQCTSPSNKTF